METEVEAREAEVRAAGDMVAAMEVVVKAAVRVAMAVVRAVAARAVVRAAAARAAAEAVFSGRPSTPQLLAARDAWRFSTSSVLRVLARGSSSLSSMVGSHLM